MSWPGAGYDACRCQQAYVETMAQAAQQTDVHLDVSPVPVHDPTSINDVLSQLKDNPPDGLVITVMHIKSWPQVAYLLKQRGDVPAIVFSPETQQNQVAISQVPPPGGLPLPRQKEGVATAPAQQVVPFWFERGKATARKVLLDPHRDSYIVRLVKSLYLTSSEGARGWS